MTEVKHGKINLTLCNYLNYSSPLGCDEANDSHAKIPTKKVFSSTYNIFNLIDTSFYNFHVRNAGTLLYSYIPTSSLYSKPRQVSRAASFTAGPPLKQTQTGRRRLNTEILSRNCFTIRQTIDPRGTISHRA